MRIGWIAAFALLALELSGGTVAVRAADMKPGRASDVEYLLVRIERSGCTFVRNGTSYPSTDAAAHLRRKVDVVNRNFTTDEFIDAIASKSSMTGQPYLVRCAGVTDVPSGEWLRRALSERPA